MSEHVIVAGVGPGVGLAVARRFAREGHAVSLIARNAEALAAHVESIASEGGQAGAFAADLTRPGEVGAAVAAAQNRFGPAGILVHNAAIWRESRAMSLDLDAFASDLALCVTAALNLAQLLHPAMKAAGRGTMLFTGGGLALYPQNGAIVPSLTAGKSALRGLVLAMAPELARDGIHAATVTIAGLVAPGTALDPDRIADHYWALHEQPADTWETERVLRG